MKVLILANRITWTSDIKKKLADVSSFYNGVVDFEFILEKTNYKNIPTVVSPNPDGNGKKFDILDLNWYDSTISIPAKQRGFDMVCFLIPEKDWKFGNVEGYGTPNNCGIEEVVVLARKKAKYNFLGVPQPGDQMTNILIHEIMHRLYASYGLEDNTHKWYLAGTPEKALPELKQNKSSIAILVRQKKEAKQTLGDLIVIKAGEVFMCKTLELPYRNNENDTSSIPTGTYTCDWTYSPKFKRYMYIVNVLNRPGIRIHSGNYFTDTEGCILVGDSYKDINADGLTDIINSKATLKKLEDFLERKSFILTVS